MSEAVQDSQALTTEFDRLTKEEGLGRREALKATAVKYSVSTRTVFAAVEESRKLAD